MMGNAYTVMLWERSDGQISGPKVDRETEICRKFETACVKALIINAKNLWPPIPKFVRKTKPRRGRTISELALKAKEKR